MKKKKNFFEENGVNKGRIKHPKNITKILREISGDIKAMKQEWSAIETRTGKQARALGNLKQDHTRIKNAIKGWKINKEISQKADARKGKL